VVQPPSAPEYLFGIRLRFAAAGRKVMGGADGAEAGGEAHEAEDAAEDAAEEEEEASCIVLAGCLVAPVVVVVIQSPSPSPLPPYLRG